MLFSSGDEVTEKAPAAGKAKVAAPAAVVAPAAAPVEESDSDDVDENDHAQASFDADSGISSPNKEEILKPLRLSRAIGAKKKKTGVGSPEKSSKKKEKD